MNLSNSFEDSKLALEEGVYSQPNWKKDDAETNVMSKLLASPK